MIDLRGRRKALVSPSITSGPKGRGIVRTRALFWMFALWPGMPFDTATRAEAQTTGAGEWQLEVHGGVFLPANATAGTVTLPGPGNVFTTATAATMPAPSSRRQSSWYFGDGAVLFNQAAAALAQLPGHIATLDPVLGRPLGERRRSGSIGVTLTRALSPRFSAELSVDYSMARLHIAERNRGAIEATRASFIPAFSDLIRFNPNRVLNTVTSTATLADGKGCQLVTSGALVVNLMTTGNIVPYALAGAGVISTSGDMASATLRGNYRFLLPGGAPIDETDSVTVRDERGGPTGAGILGGGLKYHASPRWGLRIDARVIVSGNMANTSLDAAPGVALGLLPAGRGVLGAEPSIQFSNNSSDPVAALGVTAVASSTLTGPVMTGLRTFSGTGVVGHTNIRVGVFWRF